MNRERKLFTTRYLVCKNSGGECRKAILSVSHIVETKEAHIIEYTTEITDNFRYGYHLAGNGTHFSLPGTRYVIEVDPLFSGHLTSFVRPNRIEPSAQFTRYTVNLTTNVQELRLAEIPTYNLTDLTQFAGMDITRTPKPVSKSSTSAAGGATALVTHSAASVGGNSKTATGTSSKEAPVKDKKDPKAPRAHGKDKSQDKSKKPASATLPKQSKGIAVAITTSLSDFEGHFEDNAASGVGKHYDHVNLQKKLKYETGVNTLGYTKSPIQIDDKTYENADVEAAMEAEKLDRRREIKSKLNLPLEKEDTLDLKTNQKIRSGLFERREFRCLLDTVVMEYILRTAKNDF